MKVKCTTDGEEFNSMSETDKFYEFFNKVNYKIVLNDYHK